MKFQNLLFLMIFTIVVSGCSLKEGTEALYKQENVLKIEVELPAEIKINEQYEFKAIFTERDRNVTDIENIKFTFWKNGENGEELIPENKGKGIYTIEKTFEEEGLYFVKVEANTIESKVMPTKQFIVGSLTEEDLQSLPKNNTGVEHEGHH
ncbi:FixH family protein [Litchfieldia salsa]|uniref:YtkA-like n=1 Tax=Litchfieldia salsa TaxID=930152 RepID=A0A1H0UQ97_9BACI|nr:FixH family protein [Litchfieldia salsa]SDP68399.1 YtkA-like [Litchfieldia salsa]